MTSLRVGRLQDQRGSGTALTAAVLLVAGLLTGLLLVVTGYLAALDKARGAADLVAVSAAIAQDQGRPGCQSAEVVAARNGVRLLSCRIHGDSIDFVASVKVELRVAGPSQLPNLVSAEAHAGRLSR